LAKSLLSKTSKPKTRSTSRKTSKAEYIFEIGQTCVYCGSLGGYDKAECVIVSRNRKYLQEYYHIKFSNNDEVETIGGILKSKEDYELELENQDNDSEQYADIEGSYQNPQNCLNPITFYEMRCMECSYEPKCVYRNKHDYKKIKFN